MAMGAASIDTTHACATISNVIAGTDGLVNNGGSLTLLGANSFTGGLSVTGGGTVVFSADNNLGGSGQSITLDGGTLSYNGAVSGGITETARQFFILANGGTFNVPNPGPGFGANGKLTINGTGLLTGTSNITKTGPGWLTMCGDNTLTYSGSWTVNGGVLEVGRHHRAGAGAAHRQQRR